MASRLVARLALTAIVLAACGGASSPSTTSATSDTGLSVETIVRCTDVPEITTTVLSSTHTGGIEPIFHGVLITYAAEHPETFGGLWIDREAFGTVVLAFTDDPATHLDALSNRRPSPDDLHAVDPPPEITDTRPIGEWGVAFDVVQVAYPEADLIGAIDTVFRAAQAATGKVGSVGVGLKMNRVNIGFDKPITPGDLTALTDSITALGTISTSMLCWGGQFVDEAPDATQPGTPLDVIKLPDEDGSYPTDTPVICDDTEFELGDLEHLTPLTDVDASLRAVLDGWLGGEEGAYWPQDGWSLLFERDERASFIHVGDSDSVAFIHAEMGPNGWIWDGASSGAGCDVRLRLPPGLDRVDWTLDPDASGPDASSTEIRLLATERECASGQEMGDRLLGPQVVETDDAILIAFAAIPLVGAQNCPSNPSTPVVAHLKAPLGDRVIRDGIRDGLVIGSINSMIGN